MRKPLQMTVNNPKLIVKNDGLVIVSIGKSYSKKPVVRGISLRIQKGEAVGLLGPNGAGKTTCFYMISGLIRPDYGKIILDGKDITKHLFIKEQNMVLDIYLRKYLSLEECQLSKI